MGTDNVAAAPLPLLLPASPFVRRPRGDEEFEKPAVVRHDNGLVIRWRVEYQDRTRRAKASASACSHSAPKHAAINGPPSRDAHGQVPANLHPDKLRRSRDRTRARVGGLRVLAYPAAAKLGEHVNQASPRGPLLRAISPLRRNEGCNGQPTAATGAVDMAGLTFSQGPLAGERLCPGPFPEARYCTSHVRGPS